MRDITRQVWPLLFGITLAMIGNAVQGTVLGIYGEKVGIDGFLLSIVISAYFAGTAIGALGIPYVIRSVGHVRVFPAMILLLAIALLAYPLAPYWTAWAALRLVSGACMSGIYIALESWLNGTIDNSRRGQLLSVYITAQMIGAVLAQSVAGLSILSATLPFTVSALCVLFGALPILLAPLPTPQFSDTTRISLLSLLARAPLSCLGTVLLGAVLAAIYGMPSAWGVRAGLSVEQITGFTGSLFLGGLLLQIPIGRASDAFGRPRVILSAGLIGCMGATVGFLADGSQVGYLIAGFAIGGMTNALNALFISFTHDGLDRNDMASGAAGLLLLNAIGACLGPPIIEAFMQTLGAATYFASIGAIFLVIAGMVLTQRAPTWPPAAAR